jgi:hypothetical protein
MKNEAFLRLVRWLSGIEWSFLMGPAASLPEQRLIYGLLNNSEML